MLKEIDNDIQIYTSHQIPINQKHVKNIDKLMEITDNPEEYSKDTTTHYFTMGVFRFNNWLIGDATYKSITATGKIDLVENYDLKMEIIQVYESRLGQSGFIVQQSLDQQKKMIDYLEDHIDMQNPDTWPAVFGETKFKNLLYGHRGITSSKVQEFKTNKEVLETLKKNIEKGIGISTESVPPE